MATEADCCIVATPTSTQGRRAHTREVQHRSPRRAAPTSHLRSRHGGSRGGEAAAPAHHQYCAGGSAAHRDERRRRLGGPAPRPGGRVKKPRGHRLAAPAGRPRAARQPPPRKWRGESACQLDFSSSTAAARAACASGQAACPSACSLRMRPSAPAGPSALAARQLAGKQAAKRRAAPNLHLVVDSRGGCSPAARHGLGIRHELESDAARGRIGRR